MDSNRGSAQIERLQVVDTGRRADSDDLARMYRYDLAQYSEMTSQRHLLWLFGSICGFVACSRR